MIFAFIIYIEFCSALWNYVRQVDWSLARRNARAVLGRVHFPALFMIYSNYFQRLCPAQIKHGGRVDHFRIGQYRHVSDIIGLIERNTGQCDFIQFRLDWLYNAVVRYCDNIPSGEAVMALIQEATELLRQSEGDGFI